MIWIINSLDMTNNMPNKNPENDYKKPHQAADVCFDDIFQEAIKEVRSQAEKH